MIVVSDFSIMSATMLQHIVMILRMMNGDYGIGRSN